MRGGFITLFPEALNAGNYGPQYLRFLGGAGIGYHPDSIGAGVKNFTTGSKYGGEPRRTTGQRSYLLGNG